MKNRYINTKFWDDTYICELDPIEKLLFLYFLTNPLTNLIGAYEIPIKRISFDTGIDKDMVIKIINRFTEAKKIYYTENHIIIPNQIKHQNQGSPKIKTGIEKQISELPEKVKNVVSELLKGIYTVSYINTNTNSNININNNSNNNSNSKKTKNKKPSLIKTNNEINLNELHIDEIEIPAKPINTNKLNYSYTDILLSWNEFANQNNLSTIIKLSDTRKKHIKQRMDEPEFEIEKIFKCITESDFLLGKNNRDWKVDFDFIYASKNNYLKILENKYKTNKNEKFTDNKTGRIANEISAMERVIQNVTTNNQ